VLNHGSGEGGEVRAPPIKANRFGGAVGQFFDGAAGHENGGEFRDGGFAKRGKVIGRGMPVGNRFGQFAEKPAKWINEVKLAYRYLYTPRTGSASFTGGKPTYQA
jgi:hypothetical protein